MCVCIYMCVCVCIYICMYMYIYIYISIYIYIFILLLTRDLPYRLSPISTLFIMPLFALANTAVALYIYR